MDIKEGPKAVLLFILINGKAFLPYSLTMR